MMACPCCNTDTRARCCEVGGQCVPVTEETACQSEPVLVGGFAGTITVAWCGLSITFTLAEVPKLPNFAIGVSGADGFEKACGTQNWFGTDFPATYKNEVKYLNILRYSGATDSCASIAFSINTRLVGELIINDGTRDISFGYSGSDQKVFSFIKLACGQTILTLLEADVDITCGGPAHLHCNELPTVTINEAP